MSLEPPLAADRASISCPCSLSKCGAPFLAMQLLPFLVLALGFYQSVEGSSPDPSAGAADSDSFVDPVAGGSVDAMLLVLLLALVVLGAGLALLWSAIREFSRARELRGELQRLARLLSEAPVKEGTPLYQHFRDSAHHEVLRLKTKVEELRSMVQHRDRQLAGMLQSLEGTLREFMTVSQAEDARFTRLEREAEQFREGFLISHQGQLIDRLIYILEKVEEVEDPKLREITLSLLDETLRLCQVSSVERAELMGQVVDEGLSTSVKVRGVEDTSDPKMANVICRVHTRPWAVDGTPDGRRVIRKGEVDVFRFDPLPETANTPPALRDSVGEGGSGQLTSPPHPTGSSDSPAPAPPQPDSAKEMSVPSTPETTQPDAPSVKS